MFASPVETAMRFFGIMKRVRRIDPIVTKSKLSAVSAVFVVCMLLAVVVPANAVLADPTEPEATFDYQATAVSTSGSQATVYLQDPMKDGGKTVVKISSELISADKTYTPNTSDSNIYITGNQQIRVSGNGIITITPDTGCVFVELDLTQSIEATSRGKTFNANDYFNCLTFQLTDSQNGSLSFSVWFMTDRYCAGTLDFSGEAAPVLTLDPEKTYTSTRILVKGLAASATAELPEGMSMVYSAYASPYNTRDSTITDIGTNFGYTYNLTVTNMSSGNASMTVGETVSPFTVKVAGQGEPSDEKVFDYQATAASTGNSNATVYLQDPMKDGGKTVVKISSELISANETYTLDTTGTICIAGQSQMQKAWNDIKDILDVTPDTAHGCVFVELDLAQPLEITSRGTLYNANDYINSLTFSFTDSQNGHLYFTVWFMTDKYCVGTLDFSDGNAPVLTLDPEKTYTNSRVLVKGLDANAAVGLPDGMSMAYSAYASPYPKDFRNTEMPANFGYLYMLSVTEMSSGSASMTVGETVSPFTVSVIEHDHYDTLVMGTAQNPNAMTDLVLDNRNIDYTFKYSNPELSTISKDVISKRLLQDDDTFDDRGYYLTVSESEDDDSVLITVNGTLSKNHLWRICLILGTDDNSYSFKVMFATTGYYNAVIDSSSATPVVEIYADRQSDDYILLKGVDPDSAVSCDIPGVDVTVVKEDGTLYGDLLYLKIATDNTKTANETYDVTIGSGEASVSFSMAVHTYVCLSDVNGYDYEIYSLARGTSASVSWNLGEKDGLLFKAHVPTATNENVLVSGSYVLNPYGTVGYVWDQVEIEVLEYSLEQKYVVFRVTALEDKAMHDGMYTLGITIGYNNTVLINCTVINHVDATVSLVSASAALDGSWNVTDNERLTVRLDGMSEGKTGIIKAKLYKDGAEISDYSGMLSISCRAYDDGHASLVMIALDGLQEGSYKLSLPLANDDVYELTFSTVKGAVPPSPSGTVYSLEHQAEIRGSNVRLTLDIEKTLGEELEDARLLVIAKYQGGIVVNFYSKPSLVNGSGTDVIELSKQNLVQVIVEMVDGFQTGNPAFYGWVSYDA